MITKYKLESKSANSKGMINTNNTHGYYSLDTKSN